MTDAEEILHAALERIAQWSDAYPLQVFPEVDAEYSLRAHKVLQQHGMTVDRLSASAMRHAIEGVGRIAKEALQQCAAAQTCMRD